MNGRRWSSFCSGATSSEKPSLIASGRLCESSSLDIKEDMGILVSLVSQQPIEQIFAPSLLRAWQHATLKADRVTKTQFFSVAPTAAQE